MELSFVDRNIKTKILEDAINIMRQDIEKINNFGCYERILPSKDYEKYQIYKGNEKLFYNIMGPPKTSSTAEYGINVKNCHMELETV